MQYDQDEYEVVSDIEIQMLLSDIPIDLIKENIIRQINYPAESNTNYISTIQDRAIVIRNTYSEIEDALELLNNFERDFYEFVIGTIDQKYNMGIDISNFNDSILKTYAKTVYYFLILNYERNLGRFFYRFIEKNKKMITEQFKENITKKDASTLANKKNVKDKNIVLILSNLTEIIRYIIDLNIPPLDFIQYAGKGDSYYTSKMFELCEECSVNDFVNDYLITVIDEDRLLDSIFVDIRRRMLEQK